MTAKITSIAVKFAHSCDYIILATADSQGIPHIAIAGKLDYDTDNELLKVSEWFCPKTLENLNINKHISLAAWNAESDKGYQLQGTLLEGKTTAVLNGYTEKESQQYFPQSREELLIKIENITEFRHTIHSDKNLMNIQNEAYHDC